MNQHLFLINHKLIFNQFSVLHCTIQRNPRSFCVDRLPNVYENISNEITFVIFRKYVRERKIAFQDLKTLWSKFRK